MHDSGQTHEPVPQTAGRTIRWARLYDLFSPLWFLGQERAFRNMTIDLAGVQPGSRVLDVGCGPGTLTIAAKLRAGAGGDVHGIDAAAEMIAVAREKALRKAAAVDFQVGLIEAIPFPAQRFDVVLSSLMLHHLPAELKRKGFAEIYRVLKPGGRFLAVDLQVPEGRLLRRLTALFVHHDMTDHSLETCAPLMRDAGFVNVQVGRTKYRLIAFIRGRRE